MVLSATCVAAWAAPAPAEVPPPAPESCAPLDVALILDTTTSMDPALSNLRREMAAFIADIEIASGGNYRISVVDFGEGVEVHVPFAPNNADAARAAIPDLYQNTNNNEAPEAWDEALKTAIEERSAASAGEGQIGDFAPWRPEAEKLAVLVTDARPAGFDDSYDTADFNRAFEAASDAAGRGIAVTTFFVPNGNDEPEAAGVLQRVAEVSGSRFFTTAPDGSNLTDGLRLNVSGCGADSDGDGLFDSWETDGFDSDGDGKIDIDLAAWGADPNHKDLFVQLNWMIADGAAPCFLLIWCPSTPDGSHPPNPDALEKAIEVFEKAPVENPDGTTGITLHIDAGDLSPATSAIPEIDRLGGGTVLHEDDISDSSGDDDESVANLAARRARSVSDGRGPLVTWAIYTHLITPETEDGTNLGLASAVPGDTVMIAGSKMDSTFLEAATLVHELGHTLGLRHGGNDELHGKANYPSIMSYMYIFGGGMQIDGTAGHIDLSRTEYAELDESALSETVPISDGTADVPGLEVLYWCPESREARFTSITDLVDWNCDGDTVDLSVSAVVHPGDSRTVLASRDDWGTLTFIGGVRGGLQSEGEPVEGEDGFTYEEWVATEKDYAISVTSTGDLATPPGAERLFARATITNLGTSDDSYFLTAAADPGGDWRPKDIEVTDEVEIPAGESVEIDVGFGVPDHAKGNATLRVEAVSAGAPEVTGSAAVTLVAADESDDVTPLSGTLDVGPGPHSVGDEITFTGTGFAPDSEVAVAGGPDSIVRADDDGSVAVIVNATQVGPLEVSVTGATDDEDDALVLSATVDVDQRPIEPTRIESKGSPPWPLLAVGVAALAVVAATVGWISRRNRRRQAAF